jgi:ribose 5-phosphate isomerase B
MANILIAADHAGYALKETIKQLLKVKHHSVEDFGTDSDQSMDYPDVVHPLARALAKHEGSALGILICGSGNGVCITANKHPHVRAALAWSAELARLARLHNNANVLCLPARFIDPGEAMKAVEEFLNTNFEGGRHAKRVEKIEQF